MRFVLTTIIAFVLSSGIAAPVQAQSWQAVQSESAFMSLVSGRQLTRLGIRLQVLPGGQITGKGFGADVSGTWNWSDGFFCRTLAFGSSGRPMNCQQVLVRGDTVRFIADRGAGDRADLTLR